MSDIKPLKKPPTMKDIMWEHYEATLRDDLAKSALTGLLTAATHDDYLTIEELCSLSYTYADAMLKARNAKENH